MFFATLLSFTALGGQTLMDQPSHPFVEIDFRKIERRIVKEPRYVAPPRYALFLFDPAARFRVWAVLDKSQPDLPSYDVLYFDKNGNGDLTEPGKRFVGKYDAKVGELSIRVGDLPVPGTKLVHTGLRFLTRERHGYKGFWFEMKWNGTIEVSGGYGKDGVENTAYAASPAAAPILRPTPLGLLSFAFWNSEVALPIGKASNPMQVQVGIGKAGSGPDTFCALSEHFLVPGKDRIIATLLARDRNGQAIRTRNEIRMHC